ncbi:DNRLRE domain-containing protein [Microbacterium sp. NPDC079995]|uniref:DNRLRE domain-containing protein n=1 Tax=unclassified Microbacterium TaxID=2609290 RepID=UPI00344CBA6D
MTSVATALAVVIASLALDPATQAAPRAVAAATTVTTPTTSNVRASHPRLMADSARLTQLRSQASIDPTSRKLVDRVLSEASGLKTAPRLTYKISSGQMDGSPAELVDRTYTLITAWTLTQDRSFLELLWRDLGPAATLTSWNPDNMLDSAELTHAMAIAYDWAYAAWTTTQRSQMRDAIIRLGLTPALTIYALTEEAKSPYEFLGNWRQKPVNVNIIINSAMIIGALAVAKDSTSTTVQKVLSGATSSIRYGLLEYEADGGFSEGPSYWAWATRAATAGLISLKTATGSDFGLSSVGGLSRTATFALDLRGAADTIYNFADSNSLPGVINLPLAGLARLYDSPAIGAAAAVDVPGAYTRAAQQLIMRDPAWRSAVASTGGMDARYATGIVTARSSRTSPDATHVAFRSASRFDNFHQHIDAGDFQLSALGEEWATELGTEKATYDIPDRATSSARWTYYRTSTIGHNTLTIDPSRSDATKPIPTKAGLYSSSPDEFFATTDASAAVTDTVSSWKRGVRLFDGRTQVLVQDEIASQRATDAVWAMHTTALIDIASDGRSAMLTQNGKRLLARIVSTAGTRFTDMAATALPTSPQPSQTANEGVRRLSIWFPVNAGTTTTVAVQFTPLPLSADAATFTPATKVTPLSSWKTSGPAATLTSITAGGKALTNFSNKTTSYDLIVSDPNALPTIAAKGTGTISVTQGTRSTMTARVTASQDSVRPTIYVIRFIVTGDPAVVDGRVSGDPRSRTVDGSPDTAWDPASVSSRSLVWRLGEPVALRSVMLTMSSTTFTSTEVRLEVSKDRALWSAPITGIFQGPTGTTSFAVPETSDARYIRITVPRGDAQIAEAVFLRYDASEQNVSRPVAVPKAVALMGFALTPKLGTTGQASIRTIWSTASKVSTTQKWVSSNTKVLSVSSSGGWRAVARGSAQVGVIVTSSDGISVTATASIEVSDPTRIRIPVKQDTFASGSAPTAASGGLKYLLNKPTTSAAVERIGYLGFDLTPILGREVRSAVLTVPAFIRPTEAGTTARVDLHAVTGTWSESTLTYANRPKSGATVASVLATKTELAQSADLTKSLKALVSSNSKTATYALSQDNVGSKGSLVEMASKESGRGAYIEVVLAPATADPVPPPRLGSVTASGVPSSLPVGKSATATAKPKDSTGGTFTRARVTYSSSDASILKVSSTGVVTGMKSGRATLSVTASADGISVTWTLRIHVTTS